MRADRQELLAIFIGGTIGAVLRALLADSWGHSPGAWPWATFTVNIAGAAALGYFITRFQERLPAGTWERPLLGTGFCGALTTFSTMQLELLWMLDDGEIGLAAVYAGASLLAGFLAVAATTNLTRRARLR